MTEVGKVIAHKTTHQDGEADEIDLTGIAPGVHKTAHQDAGADEIDATGLTGRCSFVDRGDPATYDFTASNFPDDTGWHDLDLSNIIPEGTIAVLFRALISCPSITQSFQIRKKGNTNTINAAKMPVIVADIEWEKEATVFVDNNRMVETRKTYPVFSTCSLVVAGWWI